MDFDYEVKIPKERIAILIGEKGSTKRKIENKLKIKLEIDSEDGDVKLMGDDSLNLLTGQNVVKAIGRGFNPNKALDLLKEDVIMETIDITEYSKGSKSRLITMRSRMIGTEGKARKHLEYITGTHISVFGKTICILGPYEFVGLARKAIESLLTGSRHATVYAWLEKQMKDYKKSFY